MTKTSVLSRPYPCVRLHFSPRDRFQKNLLSSLNVRSFPVTPTLEDVRTWETFAMTETSMGQLLAIAELNETPVPRSPFIGDVVSYQRGATQEFFMLLPGGGLEMIDQPYEHNPQFPVVNFKLIRPTSSEFSVHFYGHQVKNCGTAYLVLGDRYEQISITRDPFSHIDRLLKAGWTEDEILLLLEAAYSA